MKLRISLLLSFLFISLIAIGQKSARLVLTGDNQKYLITPSQMEYFVDESNKLEIKEVIGSHANEFKSWVKKKGVADIKKLGRNYWIRFKITDKTKGHYRWVLENMDPHIDHFSFYSLNKITKKYEESVAGYLEGFDLRDYKHKNFIFDLRLNVHDGEYYYVKVNSRHHNPFLFKVQTSNYFSYYSLNEYHFLGMFYGIMLIMAIYNLLLYFSVKDKIYIYYAVYVGACVLISYAEDGLGFQYLWSSLPFLNVPLGDFKAVIFLISLVLYTNAFLDLKKNNHRHYKLILFATVGYLVYYFLIYFTISDLQWNGILRSALKPLPFILILIASIKSYRAGNVSSRYFILGYGFVFLSIVFLVFRETGILHWYDIFSVYSFNIGLVVETVILSLALGDRIKLILREKEMADEERIHQLEVNEKLKDKVNRELEEKVQERTEELNEKARELNELNDKLKDQAEQINQMNLMLDMDNRKLQKNVTEISRARVMSASVDKDEFFKIYPNKEACFKYLAQLKWSDGYTCKKCGHENYCKGKAMYSRRCTKCRYDESATSYTIFHRLKFPIEKAFYMVFLIYESKEKITSGQFSEMLDLRQSTCWNFNKKVTERIEDHKKKNKGDKKERGWGSIVLEK